MKTIEAQNLIRRLRSGGIKVYLNPSDQVTFSSLDDVATPLKQDIMRLGAQMKTVLLRERTVREHRENLKRLQK